MVEFEVDPQKFPLINAILGEFQMDDFLLIHFDFSICNFLCFLNALSIFAEITSNDYSLIGCDLTDLNRLDKVIDSVHFNKEFPTLLLSEVVLTYVNKERYVKCM